MTKNSYGTVFEHKKKWAVNRWNPFLGKNEYIGFCPTKEEGDKLLNEKNFEFYSQYPFLLPKAISLNKRDKKYNLAITIRGKTVRVGTYVSLNEASDAKIELISKII